jgi:hypothetical protein
MTLNEGATHEINSRWPEYKQRNVALMPDLYGAQYRDNMTIGIEVVRDWYHQLQEQGEIAWRMNAELTNLLNDLAT